jgi:hypothetical protein
MDDPWYHRIAVPAQVAPVEGPQEHPQLELGISKSVRASIDVVGKVPPHAGGVVPTSSTYNATGPFQPSTASSTHAWVCAGQLGGLVCVSVSSPLSVEVSSVEPFEPSVLSEPSVVLSEPFESPPLSGSECPSKL